MKKYLAFLMLGLAVAIGGCAQTQSQTKPGDATAASATTAQPAAQATTSQDREDRIKESDAVRRSMGY